MSETDNLEYCKGEMDPAVSEAADLLYKVINHSYESSGNCLRIDIYGKQASLSDLFHHCEDTLKLIEVAGSKGAFLSMSVLEDTFKKCLPLLLVPLKEIAEGDMSQVDAVIRLKELFAENPYIKLWAQKAETYREIIESFGFRVDASDYQDLTAIMEPLLDALIIYKGRNHKYPPEIYKVRSGEKSNINPEFMTDVCIFHSEKEFVDAIMNCEKESVIAFGAIAPLNYMFHDDLYAKISGNYDARKSNSMRIDGITSEEYDMSVCDYKRYIALGVKSKDTMWIMRMPYYKDTYSDLSNQDSMYYYGKRAGYAPYQVFFEEPLAAEKDTTFLAVPRKGFRLAEIMDEMQKIWLPVFLEETVNKFFKEEPVAKEVFLPEEIVATNGNYEIIPVKCSLPEKAQLVFNIPSPESIFPDDEDALTLIHHFEITEESIKEYPVLPKEFGTEKELEDKFLENVKKAYEGVIKQDAKRVMEEQEKQMRSKITDMMFGDVAFQIARRACDGTLSGFTKVLVDGVSLVKKEWYHGEETWHPSRDEYRAYSRRDYEKWSYPYVFWCGPEANRPGVILKIRPTTGDDFALLFGRERKDLPELLQFYSEIKKYIGAPDFAAINICMTKRYYKTTKLA